MNAAADIVVTAGSPDATELAAIVVVLQRRAAVRAAGDRPRPPAPAWLRAARQEGIGGRRVGSPADLHAPGEG